jgi:sulfonate transport system substrate-binding protein
MHSHSESRNMRKTFSVAALVTAAALALTGCVAGEGTGAGGDTPSGDWSSSTLNLDFATYNPLSLIIKDQGWIEAELGDDVAVTWTQSAGSNKANEALRAGSIDVGSTAGSAALLARSNGSPIKTIDIYSQPNWSAIVVPAGSSIASVQDLKGKTIAATLGTDPYFFLLQTLQEAGLTVDDVTVQNLQHADGKAALENGSVDAWAGLDPLMATSVATAGSKIIYDNIDFNSYGFLNASEDFITNHADLAQLVVNAYEKARAWAAENPDEAAQILSDVAGTDLSIAKAVLLERTNLALSPVPGQKQHDVLAFIGPILVANNDVDSQDKVDAALESLFYPDFAEKADPSAIG